MPLQMRRQYVSAAQTTQSPLSRAPLAEFSAGCHASQQRKGNLFECDGKMSHVPCFSPSAQNSLELLIRLRRRSFAARNSFKMRAAQPNDQADAERSVSRCVYRSAKGDQIGERLY